MPYDLFWYGSLESFGYYAKKAHLEELRADERAWMQGMYIMDAIAQNLAAKKARKGIYPKEPYLLKAQKDQQQTEQTKAAQLYKSLMNWSAGVKARLNKTPPG